MAVDFPTYGKIDEDPTTFPYGNLKGPFNLANKTPTQIIEVVLPFVFVIAGLILFVMFIFGGFTIFVSAGNPEKMKQGQGMIVNALIGFLVIFAAYWIIQILETTLGFKITA